MLHVGVKIIAWLAQNLAWVASSACPSRMYVLLAVHDEVTQPGLSHWGGGGLLRREPLRQHYMTTWTVSSEL